MLFAGGLMLEAGIAASLLSLGAIDFGLIVDGSVVMMENIFKHLSEPDATRAGQVEDAAMGVDPESAGGTPDRRGIPLRIQEAAKEVGRPVFYAVIIIVVVLGFVRLAAVVQRLGRGNQRGPEAPAEHGHCDDG